MYHVAEDFAENHDLAAENRPKLIEMITQWYVEAGKYNVLPVDGRGVERLADPRPTIAADRRYLHLFPETQPVPPLTAAEHAQPLAQYHRGGGDPRGRRGGRPAVGRGVDGGYTFYVQDGSLRYAYSYVGRKIYHLASQDGLTPGRHTLRYEFEATGKPDIKHGKGAPGKGHLFIDDQPVGELEIAGDHPALPRVGRRHRLRGRRRGAGHPGL